VAAPGAADSAQVRRRGAARHDGPLPGQGLAKGLCGGLGYRVAVADQTAGPCPLR